MKNYLFTTPSGVQHRGSYTIRHLAFIFLSVFCCLRVSAAVIDSANSQQDSQNIIYISAGTEVYGAENMTVVKVLTDPLPENRVDGKKKNLTPGKQAIVQKDSKSIELKALQEKINKKIKRIFYASSLNSDLLRSSTLRLTVAATVPNFPFKFNRTFVNTEYDFNIVQIKNVKKKFFCFLSYSEFFTIRNSAHSEYDNKTKSFNTEKDLTTLNFTLVQYTTIHYTTIQYTSIHYTKIQITIKNIK